MDYKVIGNELIPAIENRQGEELVNTRDLHEFIRGKGQMQFINKFNELA